MRAGSGCSGRVPSHLAEAVPYILRLCVAALLLAVLLLALRAWILHRFQFTAWPTDNAGLALVKLFVAGSYDAGFAAGVTAGFLLLLLLFRRKREAARLIYGCFLIVGVIRAAAALHTPVYLRFSVIHSTIVGSITPISCAALTPMKQSGRRCNRT
jgi:hypothetical protein